MAFAIAVVSFPVFFSNFVLFFKGLSFFLQYLSCFVKSLERVLTSFSIFSSRFASASLLSRPNADPPFDAFSVDAMDVILSGTVIVSCSGARTITNPSLGYPTSHSFVSWCLSTNNKIKQKKKREEKKKKTKHNTHLLYYSSSSK